MRETKKHKPFTVWYLLEMRGFHPMGTCVYVREIRENFYHIGCTIGLSQRLTKKTVIQVKNQVMTPSLRQAIAYQDTLIDICKQKGIPLDSYVKGYHPYRLTLLH